MRRRTFLAGTAALIVAGDTMTLARRLLMVGGGSGSFMGGLVAALSGAKVYSNTTQVIAHNAGTAFIMTTAEYDPDGYWDAAHPTRLTVPAGKGGCLFLLMGGTYTADQPNPDMSVSWSKNGALVDRDGGETWIYNSNQAPGYGQGAMTPGPTLVYLNDGDYVEFSIYQDSSNNGNASMTFGHASSAYIQTWAGIVRLAT
jgi:hypothetical protein